MTQPVCLMGGWAVYLTMNAKFNEINGRNYIGSRDIDLGFHIDPRWSAEQLQKSALSQSANILLGEDLWELDLAVSRVIGIGSDEISRVINELAR
jgi:hypothetical protein